MKSNFSIPTTKVLFDKDAYDAELVNFKPDCYFVAEDLGDGFQLFVVNTAFESVWDAKRIVDANPDLPLCVCYHEAEEPDIDPELREYQRRWDWESDMADLRRQAL